MNENVNNFINSVQKQDYTTAKDEFQSAMADKINSAFENKKIEIAGQMSSTTNESVVVEEETETLDEKKKTRQMMDPKTETMVVKDGKVEVIDKKDVDKYMKKGYEMAEETDNDWLQEVSDWHHRGGRTDQREDRREDEGRIRS